MIIGSGPVVAEVYCGRGGGADRLGRLVQQMRGDGGVDGKRLDFLPTPEGGGFPWLRRVHAATSTGGWRFTDRAFPRSPRPVTASPAARMFLAAFTSALSRWPQQVQAKTAWLSRDFASTTPQRE